MIVLVGFGMDFHEWQSHTSFPNRLTRDEKSVFTVTYTLYIFTMILHVHSLLLPRMYFHEMCFVRNGEMNKLLQYKNQILAPDFIKTNHNKLTGVG